FALIFIFALANGELVWNDIRDDRKNSGVCPESSADLCSSTSRSTEIGDKSSLPMCRCDDDCAAFGDCCIDHPSAGYQNKEDAMFTCNEQNGRYFYTVGTCSRDW